MLPIKKVVSNNNSFSFIRKLSSRLREEKIDSHILIYIGFDNRVRRHCEKILRIDEEGRNIILTKLDVIKHKIGNEN